LKRSQYPLTFSACQLFLVSAAIACLPLPASAERIENEVAVFSALDKVSAHIKTFKVEVGQTATFGALKITPRACYSRPPTEEPKTTTFVVVDENQVDGSEKRVFTGWMFAESPGIYGLEHPTYDVWLKACEKPTRTTAERAPDAENAHGSATAGAANAGGDESAPLPEYRRRVRR
jgi:hypothetical protein